MTATSPIYFSKAVVTNQVFFKSKYSYAFVNLKPLVPGHVLICPLNNTRLNLADLTPEENSDFFNTLQIIHRFIKEYYKADALNIAIQDGVEAGQSMPHLHTHIIPRYRTNNIGDKIYTLLDEWDARRNAYGGRQSRKDVAKPDNQRFARTEKEMAEEADVLRTELNSFLAKHPELKVYSS